MEDTGIDQAVLQNLIDAGCDGKTVECFCELEKQLTQKNLARKEQICLLTAYRQALIGNLHVCQKKLDCLDYLLYRLKELEKNDGKANGDE